MTIIKEQILLLRKYFNSQFKKVFNQKKAELTRIQEKNARIEKIQEELGLPIGTTAPTLDEWEMPEYVFTVKDEEVNVEKVLTDEQVSYLSIYVCLRYNI